MTGSPPPLPPGGEDAFGWSASGAPPGQPLELADRELPSARGDLSVHVIRRTMTPGGGSSTEARGVPAIIEAAGPYVVSVAALLVAAVMHDLHAVELIAGGLVGGGVGYGVARNMTRRRQ